ncbi:sulfotransferase domain-containing protein [Sphingomonas sp. LB2R24]|uniref:sulfotransferase domain-containing protein n=1 Tax=Sphingomonas sorbitolis TaxID=3096165 RepID=UPI002FC97041
MMWSLDFKMRTLNHNLLYNGSPSDLFIASYPKSGTTWLQMIVHQILSGGVHTFSHINDVVPFFEDVCLSNGMTADEIGKPLKTHLGYDTVPRGSGKYIYITRDGKDVAVSYYHHYRRYMNYKGDISSFINLFISGRVAYGSWFKHVSAWSNNELNLNLILVRYEDLVMDLRSSILKIADFLGKEITSHDISRISYICSFSQMKENERKFALEYANIKTLYNNEDSFIREGKIGGGAQFFSEDAQVRYANMLSKYNSANYNQSSI